MTALIVYAIVLVIVSGSALGWLGLRSRNLSGDFRQRMAARRENFERRRIARTSAASKDAEAEGAQASPSADR